MTAPRLAWGLCGAALVLAALGLALLALNRTTPGGAVYGYWLEQTALAFAFPTVGALIAANRPRNPIGWILIAAGLSGALVLFASEYALYALFSDPGALPGGRVAAWVSAWAGTVAFGVIFTYLFLLFPDGRLPSARWRPVAWAAALALGLVMITSALKPRLTDEAGEPVPQGAPRTVENPVGLDGAGPLLHQIESTAIVLFVLVCVLPAVASLILRYRRSSGERRQQIKWLAYAAGMLAVGIFVVPDVLRALWGETAAVSAVTSALEVVPVIGIPLATGIAILRHRLYDIDLVIRRTLVYGALTATLGATYFGLRAPGQPRRGRVRARGGGLDAGGRGAVPPGAGAHPGRGGPPLLPPPLRRRAARWRRSGRGCAMSSTSRRSAPTCAMSCATPCSRRTSPCGSGAGDETAALGALAPHRRDRRRTDRRGARGRDRRIHLLHGLRARVRDRRRPHRVAAPAQPDRVDPAQRGHRLRDRRHDRGIAPTVGGPAAGRR